MDITGLAPATPLTIAISSCLLGNPVRYDGRAKLQPDIIAAFSGCARLLPVCPEVEIGMGVPRPPIRLVASADGAVRACGVEDPGLDPTGALEALGATRAHELRHVSGYVFKARSPSCGLHDTPVLQPGGDAVDGRGLFSATLTRAMPWLPVADENRLATPKDRDDFLYRVHRYRAWQELVFEGPDAQALYRFHQQHAAPGNPELQRIIDALSREPLARIVSRYRDCFLG